MNNILGLLPSVNSVSSVASVLKNPGPDATTADEPDALDHLEVQAEHAQAMAQDSPNVFIKAAMNIAAMDFFTVLNRFDSVTLSKRLEEKPELYFQLINSPCNFIKAELDRQKFEFKQKQAEARQREREQKLRTRKPILLSDNSLDHFSATLTRSRRREEADSSPAPLPGVASGQVLPRLHSAFSHSSTANTGHSEVLEFSVPVAGNIEMRLAGPGIKITDDQNDTSHECTEEHPEDLVCCPS